MAETDEQIADLLVYQRLATRVWQRQTSLHATGIHPGSRRNTTMQPSKIFFTANDLAQRWEGRVSVRTMANWRSQATGPRYVKIGGRIVYPVEAVLEWEQARTVAGTNQYRR